jgi:hypothetical protein
VPKFRPKVPEARPNTVCPILISAVKGSFISRHRSIVLNPTYNKTHGKVLFVALSPLKLRDLKS